MQLNHWLRRSYIIRQKLSITRIWFIYDSRIYTSVNIHVVSQFSGISAASLINLVFLVSLVCGGGSLVPPVSAVSLSIVSQTPAVFLVAAAARVSGDSSVCGVSTVWLECLQSL